MQPLFKAAFMASIFSLPVETAIVVVFFSSFSDIPIEREFKSLSIIVPSFDIHDVHTDAAAFCEVRFDISASQNAPPR